MSSVGFIPHTGNLLCPIPSRPLVLLLGICTCRSVAPFKATGFIYISMAHLVSMVTLMREGMSPSFMAFTGKFKLILSMCFRRDLREIEYILFFTFYRESFRDFHSPGGKSMKTKQVTFFHYLPPSPPRIE